MGKVCWGGRTRHGEVCGGDESEEEDQAEKYKREQDINAKSAHKQHKADQAPRGTSAQGALEEKAERPYMVTLWKAWLELYGAPVAPPSPFSKGCVVRWIGSCVYARLPQCVP